MIPVMLALSLLIAGAAALYLASPHQSLSDVKIGRAAAMGGAVALLIALVLLLTVMGPAAAVFTWLTALMLLWTVPPIAIGWLRYRKQGDAR